MIDPELELRALANLGTLMRNAQKEYFKTREREALRTSKDFEYQFDKRCNEIMCRKIKP